MRVLCTTVLCAMFPGWGLCALLCSALAGGKQDTSCCAQISAPVNCCTNAAGSGTVCSHAGASCACAHDSVPAHPTSDPQVFTAGVAPEAPVFSAPQTIWAAAPVATHDYPSARERLAFEQRLNL